MAAAVRRTLDDVGLVGDAVPILYGGSVTSANIDEFLAEPSLDGALVGGASLKADEMAGIVARAGITAAARGAASRRGPGRDLR
jgi:triosephosphate isomerase